MPSHVEFFLIFIIDPSWSTDMPTEYGMMEICEVRKSLRNYVI